MATVGRARYADSFAAHHARAHERRSAPVHSAGAASVHAAAHDRAPAHRASAHDVLLAAPSPQRSWPKSRAFAGWPRTCFGPLSMTDVWICLLTLGSFAAAYGFARFCDAI